jgi:hypothetical protein
MASGRHRSFGPGWPECTKGGFDTLDTDDSADDERTLRSLDAGSTSSTDLLPPAWQPTLRPLASFNTHSSGLVGRFSSTHF